ncbi:Eukaryotic translation initiation factor 4E-1B [Bagarius yarrelli]|uniref:Eukaryotic translation initiation factor 4E-1B n=1 Tax=Bagarius yarrelli TaxID=175774 RepID=A0A556TYE6_BAGYA|nr:Eukaryotic translation initiation factor 4E-1B [Bagarius yarrelli]
MLTCRGDTIKSYKSVEAGRSSGQRSFKSEREKSSRAEGLQINSAVRVAVYGEIKHIKKRLYHNIQTASKLSSGCDYSVFKLLCLIGEGFGPYSRDVCGAVINVRAKGDKIAVWTTNAENAEAVTYIGRKYKESLGLPSKLVIGYQAHADTASKSNSITKNKFVV